MKITNKNIEEYIHRFMEGETTNSEEQAIYRFFREGNLPEHLKQYSDMFAWYEDGMPEEKGKYRQQASKPFWKHLPLEIWSMGIAAMLVIGIGLGIVLPTTDRQSEEWACYEGSYVKVNGEYITDLKTILPIIQETLADAEAIEKRIEERLTKIQNIEKNIKEKQEIMCNF